LVRGAEGGLVRSGQGIHYAFSLSGASFQNRWLGWTVESQLFQINRRGRTLRLAKQRTEHFGLLATLRSHEIGFARAPEPGIYRYDLTFKGKAGRVLGRFHGYYIVVQRNPEFRLAIDGSTFSAGEVVNAKVEDPGTEWAFYGEESEIEQFDGTSWSPINWEQVFGHRRIGGLVGYFSDPGTSGTCAIGFKVPKQMEPGVYRITKQLDGTELSADFTIVAPVV
jgi:Big-like domain-containing protein